MTVVNVPVTLDDVLPLTCSRGGTCCHGNRIWLNPWELATMAAAKGLTARSFRDTQCEPSGNALRLNGPPDGRNLPGCSQYAGDAGCTVHGARPLPCRLFPLGRQRAGQSMHYIHHGPAFPCLDGCPAVLNLPRMKVRDYLSGQDVTLHERAHDAYLDVMQELAEGAMVLLIDSGLAATGDRTVLPAWKELAGTTPEARAATLGKTWLDLLTIPPIVADPRDPLAFVADHQAQLQAAAQAQFGSLDNPKRLSRASATMMGLAFHLGRALGAAPRTLLAHWLPIAKQNGARD